jgi:hypothetical protein
MSSNPIPKICLQKIPSQHVFLYQGFLELLDGDKIIEGKGSVRLTWHPEPRISIKFIYDCGNGDVDLDSKNLCLKLTEKLPQPRLKIRFNGQISQRNRAELHGYLIDPFVEGKTSELSSVIFHLPNFYDTYGCTNQSYFDEDDNEIELEGWLNFENQLIFDYHGWHIVLGALESCYDLNELLREQGGYGLTHICKIEKLDKSTFNLEEVYDLIEAFCYYLSLARGLWLPPILVSGFDVNGGQICEEWRTPIIRGDSWEDSDYFFDYIDSLEIVFCFPEFLSKWQNLDWREIIKLAIQWYIESLKQATSYQTSLILIQSALEQLSWIYLSNKDCLTGDNFKKIAAADQIRLFIKFLNIEVLPFPPDSELLKISKEFGWTNTIHAAVEIRNLVIHPPLKNSNLKKKVTEKAMGEAVKISRQHLRNALLELFNEQVDKNEAEE